MLKTQIVRLTETGDSMLEKASLCTVAADAKTFTELGMRAFEQAREIADTLRVNSVLLFIECCGHLGKKGTSYPSYLEFCARNSQEIVAEKDFENLSRVIFKSLEEEQLD